MTQKHSESGRSLIEVMAILAIIAILLVTALVGFRALLNYLKYKQTADEVAVVATRFKVKKFQGKACSNNSCEVRIQDYYPEGRDCQGRDGDKKCVATPDGGKVELVTNDTSTFAVIVSDIKCVSCREIVATGAYGMIIPNENLVSNNPDKVFSLGDDINMGTPITPSYAKAHMDNVLSRVCRSKEEVEGDVICPGDNQVLPFVLLYGNECVSGAQYLVKGKCSFCKEKYVKAKLGNSEGITHGAYDVSAHCCPEDDLICGYCGGCPEETPACVNGTVCYECEDAEEHCKVTDKNTGVRKWKTKCLDGSEECDDDQKVELSHCVNHSCVPCEHSLEPCKNSSGVAIAGTFCDSGLICRRQCNDCYVPDPAVPGKCVLKVPVGEVEGASCAAGADTGCPVCKEPLECQDGTCQCIGEYAGHEGNSCNSICPCKDPDLTCVDGKCIKAGVPYCAEVLGADFDEPAKRILGANALCQDVHVITVIYNVKMESANVVRCQFIGMILAMVIVVAVRD